MSTVLKFKEFFERDVEGRSRRKYLLAHLLQALASKLFPQLEVVCALEVWNAKLSISVGGMLCVCL